MPEQGGTEERSCACAVSGHAARDAGRLLLRGIRREYRPSAERGKLAPMFEKTAAGDPSAIMLFGCS